MDVRTIDINCDLGEGMSNDTDLMPFISSCSIACGGHFGTLETIRATIRLAKEHRVKVGAHPSYPDKEHFGRKRLMLDPSELGESLSKQIVDFLSVCEEEGITPNHIKLHGALYNVASTDEQTANVIVQVLRSLNCTVPVFAPPNSVLTSLLQDSNPIIREAFIDRNYQENGMLVPRNESNAVITNSKLAWEQLKQIYFYHELTVPSNGQLIPISAETYCIHGDTQNAAKIARFIFSKLKEHQIILGKNA